MFSAEAWVEKLACSPPSSELNFTNDVLQIKSVKTTLRQKSFSVSPLVYRMNAA